MKKFIFKNKILIIVSLLFTITLITLSIIPTNYDITSPGNINKVNSVINVENGYDQKGSFNTTSVYVNERTSLLKYLLAHLSKSNIIDKSSEIVDGTDIRNSQSGVIQKNISIYNAIICAYKKAEKAIEYRYEGVIIHTLMTYATLDLNVGDIISKIDGVTFNNSDEFLKLFNEARFNEKYYNDDGSFSLPMTINGTNKIINSTVFSQTEDGLKYPVFGINYYDYHSIVEESTYPQFSLNKAPTTGPSGGLMQALSIYNALTEFDYTYGLKIAGTGTIEIDGTVGAIGGMYSKIFTAYYEGVDIFFVPYYESNIYETNYQEALRAYKALGEPNDFIIVPVSTFDEAVDYLINMGGNYA